MVCAYTGSTSVAFNHCSVRRVTWQALRLVIQNTDLRYGQFLCLSENTEALKPESQEREKIIKKVEAKIEYVKTCSRHQRNKTYRICRHF